MPLGGLGAGQIALCGDGGLRQWQIVNQVNHLGFVPDTFFAIRASSVEPVLDVMRILQSREVLELPEAHTPMVNDNVIPLDQRLLLERFPSVQRATFTGAYPFARIVYEDGTLPVDVELEAWCPFVPLEAEASGLPVILFTFHIRSHWNDRVHGCLGATLQNAVGWDGVTPISGNRCPLYGGNVNHADWQPASVSLVMDNPALPDDHPGAGQLVLTALTPDARVQERWTTAEQFLRFMEGFHLAHRQLEDPLLRISGHAHAQQRFRENSPILPAGPSPAGETWNGGLLVPYDLEPGEATDITFVLAWYFPNRYVNFAQFGRPRDYGRSRFWLGNAYGVRWANAMEVAEYVIRNRQSLESASRAWSDGLLNSTLPDWLAEALSAQACTMRSPTCFWTADGKFFGFEGCLGASSSNWNATYGGSCPLNCTHVWNYEQALSKLFPQLERTMRETDLENIQAPEGYIPHRTYMPLYLPQFWDEPIGGPDDPALDGMLGTVLKAYREVRQGAGQDWLSRLWPSIKRLVEYIVAQWDPDRDGVLDGKQPNTYDIAFYGANMFIGALWLAALRAGEEMARLQGEESYAEGLHELFQRGSAWYDELLWDGEYYIQVLDESAPKEHQYGTGCLSDQLFGQWWAHLLDLGYILPEEHVRTALRSIVRYNFRQGFQGFEHRHRVFADRDDSGLLVCTWPHGGRPDVPVRYTDEAWTGAEYQVGAHCIMEGLVDEGLQIIAAVRARYSGTRRNPYNEVENGDHYARSMAGWSVLEAISGFRYNAVADELKFAPVGSPDQFRVPFITGTGWGTFEQSGNEVGARTILSCAFGDIRVRKLTLTGIGDVGVAASFCGERIMPQVQRTGPISTLTFEVPLILQAGSRLEIMGEPWRQ